jgi:hypothetical protein
MPGRNCVLVAFHCFPAGTLGTYSGVRESGWDEPFLRTPFTSEEATGAAAMMGGEAAVSDMAAKLCGGLL